MKLAFYPGCSLEGMANDYARSIEAVFRHLGIELVEIDDWSCCGATAAHSLDEVMAVALPARNLAAAEKMGLDIVAPCANCFNRLQYARTMVRRQIYDIPWQVSGRLAVHDMTRFLAQESIVAQIRQTVRRPLSGMKVVCYYGCQMVRPPRITGFTDYENPLTLDRLSEAIGADAIDWSYKTTCRGASIGIGRRDIQLALTGKLLNNARRTGADAVVVSCPLCQSNLDLQQVDTDENVLPIFYFTELIQLAFETGPVDPRRFAMHVADPVPLLQEKGVLP